MAFSQSGISDVRVMVDGSDLFVAWSATEVPGLVFQVYLDRRLAWQGTGTRCHLPFSGGAIARNLWVEVGRVAANEPTRDYALNLVAPGGRSERAALSWSGGTYLDPTGQDDIAGFRIYQGAAPGLDPDLAWPVAVVAAYPGGWINDGFGKGGFGLAGFGRAATSYTWQSGPLASGTWRFVVVPVDHAGNTRGSGQAATVVIQAAPRPPAPNANGARLTSTYVGPSDPRLTLNWLPSPLE